MSIAINKMTAAMVSCIGAHETNGDNVNYITHWYGEDGQPWCDMTVTYAAYHSGNAGPVCFNYYHDYTVEHAQTFADAGQWHVDVAGIRAGDIVFFDWAGSNSISEIDHVGYVEYADATGVHTIEGNIDNVCKRMVRQADTIVGYGRPLYPVDPIPTPVPVPVPTPVPVPAPVPTLPSLSLQLVLSGNKPAVLLFQKALARAVGLDYSSGPGIYGPMTTTACAKFQRLQGWSGSDADGVSGPSTLARLAAVTKMFNATA